MPLGLGIDFEHIHHTPAYRSLDGTPRIPIDIEEITTRLLRLLDRHDAQATFFVVADLAEEYSGLVREIANQGHEIASHTVTHPSLPSLDSDQKRKEIHQSKATLESVSESTVEGFRAPTFQVDDEVYSLLVTEGYTYSSSTVPSLPIPGFYSNDYNFRGSTDIHTASGRITEQPVAVNPWFRLPVSGAWARMLGRTYLLRSIGQLLEQGLPVLTYVHPWEFTSLWDTPLPFRNRVRTGDWLFDTYEQLLEMAENCIAVHEIARSEEFKTVYEISEP